MNEHLMRQVSSNSCSMEIKLDEMIKILKEIRNQQLIATNENTIQNNDESIEKLNSQIKACEIELKEKDGLIQLIKAKDDLIDALKMSIDLLKANNAQNIKLTNETDERPTSSGNVNKLTRKLLQLPSISQIEGQTEETNLNEKLVIQPNINFQKNDVKRMKREINALNLKIKEKDNEIVLIKRQTDKLERERNRVETDEITTFLMILPGMDRFVATLVDNIAGPGWIVIQRRFDDSVDFKRDMQAYCEGFGNPKGEFWLGLEKIHRITTQQRHELYIHIEKYDEEPVYNRYDNFIVGSAKERYKLKSLGKFVGIEHDLMFISNNQEFRLGNNKCGWWYFKEEWLTNNLNSICLKTVVYPSKYKAVSMLIRAKND